MELRHLLERSDLPDDVRETIRRHLEAVEGQDRPPEAPSAEGVAPALGLVLDAVTDMVVFYTGPDLRIAYANRAAAETVGLTSGDLQSRHCYDLWHQRSDACPSCPVLLAFETGEAREEEVVTPDGRAFLLRAYPVLDAQGGVTGVLEVGRNITDQRATQAAAHTRRVELEAIYQNAPVVMMVVDSQRRVRKVNGFAEEFSGKAVVEMIGLRGGEALGCLHALDDPDGCGHGPHCAECAVRRTVLDTLETGAVHHQQEMTLPFMLGETEQAITFLVSSTPLNLHDEPMALVSILDITDRKRMEEALRESEARYRLLADNTLDAIWQMDLDLRFTYVNPACEATLGYTPEEFIGTHLSEHCTPLHLEQMRTLLSTALERWPERISMVFETVLRHRDGTEVPCETHATLLADDQGAPLAVQGTTCDITDRNNAVAALRRSEERYRCIVETANEGVWEMDADLRTTHVNPQMADLLGYTPQEMVGRIVMDFMPPDQLPDHDRKMTARREGLSDRYERAFIHSEGHVVWTLVSATPLRDGQGRFVGSFAMLTDITDWREAERALRESEARLSSILSAAPVGIGLLTGRVFQEVNQAMCRMTGYTRDELLGQSARMLYATDEEFDYVGREKYGQIAERGVGVVETCWKTRQGAIIDVLIRSMPVEPGKPERGITITALDITERKRAEDSTRLAAVGQLSAGVAHEFNNLLAGMMLGADHALMTRRTADYERLAELVRRQARRGARICSKLSTFSRPRPPEREPLFASTAIDGALSLASRQLEIGGVTVTRQELSTPVRILADVGQLEQVFLNLFINASHAMPEGGEITIITDYPDASDTTGEGMMVARVTDTGEGMSPEVAHRVFEPFFTTKGRLGDSDLPGTGLGLTVSHGIVAAHGGSITVQSVVGEGTTFELRFPVWDGTPVEPSVFTSVHRPVPRTGRRLRILLAEDEDDLRHIIETVLRQQGHHVEAVDSAGEAVELLDTEVFELVITDLLMPGGGGSRVIDHVKGLGRPAPVIVITGRSEQAARDRVMELGAVAFLSKPVTARDILETVDAAIKNAGEET